MESIKRKICLFLGVQCCLRTCSDILSAPDSKSNDGFICITYILNNVSRCELIDIMLSLSNGKFINHKKVKLIKTNKFTLDTNSGMIVVDGELINYKKLMLNVIRQIVNFKIIVVFQNCFIIMLCRLLMQLLIMMM